MSVFEVQYVDAAGTHADAVEAWDDQSAIQAWREQHRGECVQLVDISCAGTLDALEVA